MTIDLIGGEEAERTLAGIATRLDDATPIMRREAHLLETAEKGVFAELGGRYVDTGETMRSLTLPEGPHAIRAATPRSLEFGTSVHYARYLTERVGPVTPAGGLKRPLPVAVLKLSPATAQQIADDVLDQVVAAGGGASFGGALIGGML
jgi:hypothetical protein